MSYVNITAIPNGGKRMGRKPTNLTAAFDAALKSGQALETISYLQPHLRKKQRDVLYQAAKRRGFKLASTKPKVEELFITYWGEK